MAAEEALTPFGNALAGALGGESSFPIFCGERQEALFEIDR